MLIHIEPAHPERAHIHRRQDTDEIRFEIAAPRCRLSVRRSTEPDWPAHGAGEREPGDARRNRGADRRVEPQRPPGNKTRVRQNAPGYRQPYARMHDESGVAEQAGARPNTVRETPISTIVCRNGSGAIEREIKRRKCQQRDR